MYKLVVNKIRCKFCGDVIESRSVHDFVQCRCGKCSTDGGQEYAQRSFITENPEDTYEDCSLYLNTETGKIVSAKEMNQADIPIGNGGDAKPVSEMTTEEVVEKVQEAVRNAPDNPDEVIQGRRLADSESLAMMSDDIPYVPEDLPEAVKAEPKEKDEVVENYLNQFDRTNKKRK